MTQLIILALALVAIGALGWVLLREQQARRWEPLRSALLRGTFSVAPGDLGYEGPHGIVTWGEPFGQ
ncbi:hypothetical protein LCGC14_1993290 [marine sediment metagenome]|uniref:Uncharacterized protein n=1 Tax=marine sediment metagenome TaxID=412755 RepID=A0A0F9I2L8_9ZZZZ